VPDDRFLNALRRAVPTERVLVGPARLLAYASDALTHFRGSPRAVVLPESTEEVVDVVTTCAEFGVPITPRGAGTGLSGGATPVDGGVVVETARMNRILELDGPRRIARVEPGVINQHLSDAARPLGLYYAPDPSSQSACSIGGNVAENAGGPHCFKYGATEKHVLALEVVLPDGSVETFGATHDAPHGPDLRALLLGSEGTLGVVTEITCRLLPLPETTTTLLASYADVETACRAVGDLVAAGSTPSALEALDRRTIEAVEASVYRAGYPEDAGCVLLVEFDGPPEATREASERAAEILLSRGATTLRRAADAHERKLLWRGRKGAFGAMGRLAPDLYVQDAVVPRTKLPEILAATYAICDRLGLKLANVFHAGDGNLHPNISYDGRDPDETDRVVRAGREIVEVCLAAGGALSGEHGVGLEKREFMPLLFDEASLDAMERVRATFDPKRAMNPGKLLPTPRACGETKPPRAR
jgi:glycolate oxidase subunit GlcD